MKSNNLKWKYLSIIFSIFIVLIVFRVFFDTRHHQEMLDEKIDNLEKNIQLYFDTSIDTLKQRYYLIGEHILNHDETFNFYKQNDREGLYNYLLNDYEKFKKAEENLYVVHFFDTNNTTFLRMHKPKSFNDNLTNIRPIIAHINKTLKKADGFEAGKNGIVYRISMPYLYKNEHLGVLEFGIKPQYFTDKLKQIFDIHTQIMIKTDLTKTLQTKETFKVANNYSILKSDLLLEHLSQYSDAQNKKIIQKDDKTYVLLNNLYIKDYLGNKIAKIVIAKDISLYVSNYTNSLFLINGFTIAILIFGMVFLYIIFTKYTKELNFNSIEITKLNIESEHFRSKANSDELTKTYNKRYFDKYLENFIHQKRKGVLMFLDIDHFKEINDNYGHLRGDQVLQWLSDTIKTFLRSDDIFARWGGEEFVILIEDIDSKTAQIKAESIRVYIEQNIFFDGLKFTISIGIASLKEQEDITHFISRADELLYKAKNSGRNCIKTDVDN